MYSFRAGQWLDPNRGSAPIAWGCSPLLAQMFPGLWTATPMDTFFATTLGVGYTHPWNFKNMTALEQKSGELIAAYMPPGPDNWVDIWEGPCSGSDGSANPCVSLYQTLLDDINTAAPSGSRLVAGFSQQPTSPLKPSCEKCDVGTLTRGVHSR